MRLRPGQTNRRQLLTYIVSTAAFAGLAGCTTSGSEEDNSTETGTYNETETPAETGTPEQTYNDNVVWAADRDGEQELKYRQGQEQHYPKGLNLNLEKITLDNDTYTFHGSVVREPENEARDAQDRIFLNVWLEHEIEDDKFLPIGDTRYYTDELADGEKAEFKDLTVKDDSEEYDPTHAYIHAAFRSDVDR